MSEPRNEQARARAPRGLRWIAVLVALVFGCTTVRAPASAIGGTVPVTDGRPEPQLELWVESARKISPAESAKAAAEARAALASAVAARQAPSGDELLVVRAQGIVRTGSRKTSQGAAVAGIVVGAVVIVVVALVMLVSGDGHGSGGKRGSAKAPARVPRTRTAPARGAAAGAAAAAAAGRPSAGPRPGGAPIASPVRASPGPRAPLAPAPRLTRTVRPSPGPWVAPGPVGPVYPLYPGPYVGGSYVGFDVWWGFSLDLTPYPYAYEEEPWDASWEAFPPDAGAPWPSPWPPPPHAGAGAPAAPAADVTTVTLAPPPELRVGDRDFFDGDETVLELVWVDRHTGAPLRAKTVRSGADPRDAHAVGKLLDRALQDGSGWEPFVEPEDGAPAAAGE